MDRNKFHLAVLVALGPHSLRLNVWTQYLPLTYLLYSLYRIFFFYLTFFTAVARDATSGTYHLCCFLTNCTLNNSPSHKCHLDRNTEFSVIGWVNQWHPGNFDNTRTC